MPFDDPRDFLEYLEERRELMLTPAMRANTRYSPGASQETGSTMRRVSAFTAEAWWEKESTRSPGCTPVTSSPAHSSRPTLPYPVSCQMP